MRVLVIEDDMHVTAELMECIANFKPSIEVVLAGSRTSGIEALRNEEFDFIVCDLRLPPYDGGIDAEEAHGLSIHSEAKEICPGTPCLFFTGFGTSASVREALSGGGTQDVLGNGENYGMTRLLTKDNFLACVERIKEFNTELAILNDIKIDYSGGKYDLDQIEQRALLLLTRSLEGAGIEAVGLGGYSGSQALRATVKDGQHRTIGSYFAKIGVRAKMIRERDNYHRHIEPLLGIGDYPALVREREAGIGKRQALFYQLAAGYTRSLFRVLETDESLAIDVVNNLREIFVPWKALREKNTIRVRDLRRERIDDDAFRSYADILASAGKYEENEREITMSCQHGDLHGHNVLCDDAGRAVIIDFGNVGPAPSCLDPLLLELSILFHGDSPFRNDSWPTSLQAEAWFNLEEYLIGCPVPEFIRKCREWAYEACGQDDLAPVVYAESVRQLKYQDTNHHRALGIARAAMHKGS